jgi:hypothetical protein
VSAARERPDEAKDRPVEPASAVEVHLSPSATSITRCPFCHDEVSVETVQWVLCRACQARHHLPCWSLNRKRCATCGGKRHLRAAPAIGRRTIHHVLETAHRAKGPYGLIGYLVILSGIALWRMGAPGYVALFSLALAIFWGVREKLKDDALLRAILESRGRRVHGVDPPPRPPASPDKK